MNFVVIGDMHLGKKILDMVHNNYDQSMTADRMYQLWSFGIIRHIKENIIPIVLTSNIDLSSTRWVFLGDVLDYPSVGMVDEFQYLLEYILEKNDAWSIDILVGNHDSRKPGFADKTALTKFQNYRNRVRVYHEFFLTYLEDKPVLFFPYVKTTQILPVFMHIKEQMRKDEELLVFSHNNIYITDAFLTTPMIAKPKIEQKFEHPLILFNGHIHRTHYEPNYYQVGAAIPTSFKETPQASGCCLFSEGKITVLRNNKIMLLSISSEFYLQELEWYFKEARNFGTVFFVKIARGIEKAVMPLLKKYKDIVPGIALDS